MAVPSSGEISLSKILREIQYCDFVGTSGYGGYLSNGTMTATNISLSALDTNSSVRTADTNRGDGSAPYAMSEWHSYSDLKPDIVNALVELTESVSGSPEYRIQFYNGTSTRTFFVGGAYGNTITAEPTLSGNTNLTIYVQKTVPSSTAQADGYIEWWSVESACTGSVAYGLDQTTYFLSGDSITNSNFNYSYTNVQIGYSYKITILESSA